MADQLTIGELIAALGQYETDRLVVAGATPCGVASVVSIEPGGAVILVPDVENTVDPLTCEIRAREKRNLLDDLRGWTGDG